MMHLKYYKNRYIIYIARIAAAALIFVFAALGCEARDDPPEQTADPYEGMIQVSDGAGGLLWIEPYENLPVSRLDADLFTFDGKYITYTGGEYAVERGIDVSFYQGQIDWGQVAGDGIDFAMIRAGYRGYSEGGLFIDDCFESNIQGALENSIGVGIYFFSQATSEQEARQEARFVLELIDGYEIAYPVAFDWEYMLHEESARTNGMTGDEITQCCKAFCEIIEDAGYEPAVYFNRRQGYFDYSLGELEGLTFWISAPGTAQDFYYECAIWQYSFEGRVAGIDENVDLNLLFR